MNEVNEREARDNAVIAKTFESARTLIEFERKPLWRMKIA